jgi:hypothetical protein
MFAIIAKLDSVDFSNASTPKLNTIYLAYNQITSIKLPQNANELAILRLCTRLIKI